MHVTSKADRRVMGHRGMDTNNVPFAKGLTVSHLSCVDVNAIRG